jgi:integrase
MAYFRQRGDAWCFTIDLPKEFNGGKRNQKLVTYDDAGNPFLEERDARRYAEKMEEEIKRGKRFDSISFKSFTDKYFVSQICVNVSESTYENQEQILNKYLIPAFGKMKIDKINDLIIDDVYEKWLKTGMSRGMLRNVSVVLSKSFRFARKKRFILENPMLLVRTPTYKAPAMEVFTEQQMHQFLEYAINNRHHSLYTTALTTGARIGELLCLTWDDIDFENATMRITKTLKKTKKSGLHVKPHTKTTNSMRTIDVPRSTLDILQEHKKKQMIGVKVIFNRLGNYFYPTAVSRDFSNDCVKYGLPKLHFHCLRHTHATLLLQPPEPISVHIVALRLGDTVQTVMNTYSHVLPKAQETAIKKLDWMMSREKTEEKS